MARGADGKARRNEARKESRAAAVESLFEDGTNDFDQNDDIVDTPPTGPVADSSSDDDDDDDAVPAKEDVKSKRKTRRTVGGTNAVPKEKKGGIKTLPLIILVILTGTTLLPALLFMGDKLGSYLQNNGRLFGRVGRYLHIGPSPKKRVLSFYEKHDPDKLDQVDGILSKYYGDYPTLVKRLERKYHDYGYFLHWEKDEAPMTLAFDRLYETRDYLGKKFDAVAPSPVKTGVRNIKYNVGALVKKGRRIWKKKLWPVLEPYLGVPDGAAAQKRKDAKSSAAGKGRRKRNTDYRDDQDEH